MSCVVLLLSSVSSTVTKQRRVLAAPLCFHRWKDLWLSWGSSADEKLRYAAEPSANLCFLQGFTHQRAIAPAPVIKRSLRRDDALEPTSGRMARFQERVLQDSDEHDSEHMWLSLNDGIDSTLKLTHIPQLFWNIRKYSNQKKRNLAERLM